jgi:hypothetical protein
MSGWTTLAIAAEVRRTIPPAELRAVSDWLAAHARGPSAAAIATAYLCGVLTAAQPTAAPPPMPAALRHAAPARRVDPPVVDTWTPPAEEPARPPEPTPGPAPVEESEPSRDDCFGSAVLTSIPDVVAWCAARHYLPDGVATTDRTYSAASYSVESEPGAVWLHFRRRPDATMRASVRTAGFRGVYDGTYIDRRGQVRRHFAGWRWQAPVAHRSAA